MPCTCRSGTAGSASLLNNYCQCAEETLRREIAKKRQRSHFTEIQHKKLKTCGVKTAANSSTKQLFSRYTRCWNTVSRSHCCVLACARWCEVLAPVNEAVNLQVAPHRLTSRLCGFHCISVYVLYSPRGYIIMQDTSDAENFPAQVKISVITLGQICRYAWLCWRVWHSWANKYHRVSSFCRCWLASRHTKFRTHYSLQLAPMCSKAGLSRKCTKKSHSWSIFCCGLTHTLVALKGRKIDYGSTTASSWCNRTLHMHQGCTRSLMRS